MYPRFPGKRGISKTKTLTSTTSTWTLGDPKDRHSTHRADPLRQETMEEPGPPDPSVGNSGPPEPEPKTSVPVKRHRVTAVDKPNLPNAVNAVESPKVESSSQTRNDPSAPRQPVGKWRKFMKSMLLPLRPPSRRDSSHTVGRINLLLGVKARQMTSCRVYYSS